MHALTVYVHFEHYVDPIDVYVCSFERITLRAMAHFGTPLRVRTWAHPADQGHVMKNNRLSGKLKYI